MGGCLHTDVLSNCPSCSRRGGALLCNGVVQRKRTESVSQKNSRQHKTTEEHLCKVANTRKRVAADHTHKPELTLCNKHTKRWPKTTQSFKGVAPRRRLVRTFRSQWVCARGGGGGGLDGYRLKLRRPCGYFCRWEKWRKGPKPMRTGVPVGLRHAGCGSNAAPEAARGVCTWSLGVTRCFCRRLPDAVKIWAGDEWQLAHIFVCPPLLPFDSRDMLSTASATQTPMEHCRHCTDNSATASGGAGAGATTGG